VRKRPAQRRAQARGVGLAQLGRHRDRRRPHGKARAEQRDLRRARRAERVPHEVAAEADRRRRGVRPGREVHRAERTHAGEGRGEGVELGRNWAGAGEVVSPVLARAFIALLLLLPCTAAPAAAAGDARVAAIQVALLHRGLYAGPIDGIAGPGTRQAVVALQTRAGLARDGIAGPRTLAALGGHAKLGGRVLVVGVRGLDVAGLQFSLAWHGFPSGAFDGDFGLHTDAAVRRFQTWSGLGGDG